MDFMFGDSSRPPYRNLKDMLKDIKLLACDFDGVMTDGHVLVREDGLESVYCSRRDGMGIALLKRAGVAVCVISSEANPVVSARCKKLNIPCYQKVESTEGKLDVLKRVVGELGLAPHEVAFMGDDINDLAALEYAGVAFSVFDGHQKVKDSVDYVTEAHGGKHAVREVCDLILCAQGKVMAY